METKEEVVSKIKQIALDQGFDAEKAEALALKCYQDIPSWKPYGGATSFDQIDQQRAVGQYSGAISEQTYELRGIVDNITDSSDFSFDQKADAIKAAADDFKKRVGAIPLPTAKEVQADPDMGTKEEMSFMDHVKSFFVKDGEKRTFNAAQRKKLASSGAAMPDGSFPIENEQDLKNALHDVGRASDSSAARAHIKKRARALGLTSILGDSFKEDLATGFKVFQDKQGNFRWLSYSSNAFEDNQKELFTTAALEEAVEHADKTGQRGPLLYFHVKSAEIGQCDFQAVQGRFLIESGTFNDTPLGQKALEYLLDTDEDQQVSIGFKYREGDEKDGQYDWFRFNERSVLPAGFAANPYTKFFVFGEEDAMNPIKEESLKTVFGDDMTKQIIEAADSKTKELEEAGVKHKENLGDVQTIDFGEITGVRQKESVVVETIEHEHGDVVHTHVVQAGKSHVHDGISEAYKAKMPMDAEDDPKKGGDNGKDEAQEDAKGNKKKEDEDNPVLAAIKELGAQLLDVKAQVKDLQKSDDERIADTLRPRVTVPEGQKPSESNDNTITEDEANFLPEGLREQLKDIFSQKAVTNPAAVWASDIVHGPQGSAN